MRKISFCSVSVILLLIINSCQSKFTPVQLTRTTIPSLELSAVKGNHITHFELQKEDRKNLEQQKAQKLSPRQRRRQKKISGQVVTGLVLFGIGLLLIIFGGDDLYLPGTIMTLVGAGFVLFGLI